MSASPTASPLAGSIDANGNGTPAVAAAPATATAPRTFLGAIADKLAAIRTQENLPCPGSFENLHIQTKMMQPTNHLIEGAKYEFTSIVSQNFQVLHSLAWGKAQEPASYNFGAFLTQGNLMAHGNVDDKGSVSSRLHYSWTGRPTPEIPPHDPTKAPHEQAAPVPPPLNSVGSTSKLQFSAQGAQSMIQVEHEFIGSDWSAVARAVNPNPIDTPVTWKDTTWPSFTGVFQFGYLKSVTSSLALGAEFTYEHLLPDNEAIATTYALRYAPKGQPLRAPSSLPPGLPSPFPPVNPKDSTEVFTATYTPARGVVHASYWRKINQRLEFGTEAQLLIEKFGTAGPSEFGSREGIANVGLKLDTVQSTVRTMIDTSGKISTFIDERIIPGIAFQLSGTLDFFKGYDGKVGIGFTIEG